MSVAQGVIKNAFFLSIGQFTILATGIIWTALLARYIGPETYGIYAYAQSIVSILAIFVNFGFDQLLIRDVAQKLGLSNRYLVTVMLLKLFLSALIFGGFVIYGYLWKWSGERTVIMRLVTASYFETSICGVLISLLYAHQAMKYDTLSKTIRAILALGIGILAIQMRKSFPVILTMLLAISIFPILLNIYYVRKLIFKSGIANTKSKWSFHFAFQTLVKSIPFAALSLIAVLYTNVVILLLRHLAKDDSVIGNFAAAQRIYSMLFIVPAMFLQAIFPAFSSIYTESYERFRSMFEQAYRYMFIITIPMAIGLWVTAPQVVHLIYGKEFSTAGSAVRILSLQLLNGVGYVMGPAMTSMGHQTLSATLYGFALIGVASVGYLAIPRWGANGACWAVVAGNLVGFVVYAIILFRWLKLSYPWLWIGKVIIASIVMGVIVYILIPYVNFLIVSFAVAPIVYLILHRILKTFSSADYIQMRKITPNWLPQAVTTWMVGNKI